MTTVLLIIIGVLLAALALCIFLVVNLRRMLILTNKAYALTKEALESSNAEYNRVKKDFNKITNKTIIEKTKLN